MTVLLIAEHDNKSLKDATHKADRREPMGGECMCVAGHKAEPPQPRRRSSPASRRSSCRSATSSAAGRADGGPHRLVRGLEHIVAAATTNGKN